MDRKPPRCDGRPVSLRARNLGSRLPVGFYHRPWSETHTGLRRHRVQLKLRALVLRLCGWPYAGVATALNRAETLDTPCRVVPIGSNQWLLPEPTTMSTAPATPITSLAAVVGRWKIEDGKATCEAPESADAPYGLCVSSVRFLLGEAQVTVQRTNGVGPIDARIVFGYRSEKQEYVTVGLHSEGKAYQIVHYKLYSPSIGGWYPLAETGLAENLAVGRPFTFRVLVRGQRISLEAEGIRVLEYSLPFQLPYGQLGLYSWLRQGGIYEFTDFSARAVKGDAFVVMQFSGFEELYSECY